MKKKTKDILDWIAIGTMFNAVVSLFVCLILQLNDVPAHYIRIAFNISVVFVSIFIGMFAVLSFIDDVKGE